MKKFLALIACGLTIGCASTKMAPRFDVPSTAPIEQAHKDVERHGKKARKISKDIEKDCPQAKALIDGLNAEIDSLLAANAQGEGARQALDTQLKQQTAKANNLADNYDKAQVTITAKNEAIARRNKILAGLVLINIACLAFIFRKPLLALIVA